MILDFELALRFLRQRTARLLRGTAAAALAGVALATMALVITLALMEGYRAGISAALQSGNAHIVAFLPQGMDRTEADLRAASLREVAGVARATAVTYLGGLVEVADDPSRPQPVVLKAVAEPPAFTGLEHWPDDQSLPTVVGRNLAETLNLRPGDTAVVMLPPGAGSWIVPALDLSVVGEFDLSFSEFNDRWMVVPLDGLLTRVPGLRIAGVEIMLDDPVAVEGVRAACRERQPDMVMTDWREVNGALFAALRWQTLSLFVVLTLVVAVASFQVSSALVVLSIDKRRAAGTLQALGASRGRIWRILTIAGVTLGGVGVVVGATLGVVVSLILTATRVIRFPHNLAEIYLVDHVAFLVRPWQVVGVVAVCLVLVVLAAAWPALQTARRTPAESLRAV